MIYLLVVPDDLSGYETNSSDFEQALLGTIETWLGPHYKAYKGPELPGVPPCAGLEAEPLQYNPRLVKLTESPE